MFFYDLKSEIDCTDTAKHDVDIKPLEYYDEFFVDAARFSITMEKASIGYFQRKFKIGFNRAARIMEQLYEAGIVAAEEGTKPRRVLISTEQLEKFIKREDIEGKIRPYSTIDEKKIIVRHDITELNFPKKLTLEQQKQLIREKTGIIPDYSNNYGYENNIKNIIIPQANDEIQVEYVNYIIKYNPAEKVRLILGDYGMSLNYNIYSDLPNLYMPVFYKLYHAVWNGMICYPIPLGRLCYLSGICKHYRELKIILYQNLILSLCLLSFRKMQFRFSKCR